MLGCFLAVFTFRPAFEQLTIAANPDLYEAQQISQVLLIADPKECSIQFNPTGTAKFTSSCDVAKQKLSARSVSSNFEAGSAGVPAIIKVGDVVVNVKPTPEEIIAAKEEAQKALADLNAQTSIDEKAVKAAEQKIQLLSNEAKNSEAVFVGNLAKVLKSANYPPKADPDKINKPMVVIILTYLVLLVTMVYGPIAAMLVEMFPTRIRYTSMSLPYHIGNGWFGGLLPASAVAIVAQTGNMYNGLWYPIIIAGATFIIGTLFITETKDVDIYADD
jgi:hypothetical protein